MSTTMFIKVVEFYPKVNRKDYLVGSLHVRISNLQIDLRGIFVKKKGDYWYFGLPYSYGLEKGRKVKFPAFVFTDNEMTKELKKQIYEKGKRFIERKVLHTS